MEIHFIFGGQKGGSDIESLVGEYLMRLMRTDKVEVTYCSSKAAHIEGRQKDESDLILRHVKSNDYFILLDERGREVSSSGLAKKIERCEIESKRLVVCVGGAYGVNDEVRSRADSIIAFSKMIFPHEIARILAVEQVYRGRSILRGSKYHHEG